MAVNEEIVAQAQQLYVSYYGRPADPGGLDFWAGVFADTDDVGRALAAFGESPEYRALIEGLGNREIVNDLYRRMFNRDGDEAGLNFYLGQLESGAASLASIALDIANGARGDDVAVLDNKVAVANTFTEAVREAGAAYEARHIAGARELLAGVEGTGESRAAGNAAAEAFVEDLSAAREGGEFTLNEDEPRADFSGAAGPVTVTLDGDEAEFDVRLSAFDDTVVVEELKSAAIRDAGGIDTLDLSGHGGAATVSLLAGTFRLVDGAERFAGTLSGIENVVGTDGDDSITGDNADNRIVGGRGDDTLRGGVGDDVFVFEDPNEIGAGTVDGQTGTDTAVFTYEKVDLSGVLASRLAVENLMLANAEGEDEVTLTLAAAGATDSASNEDVLSVDDFDGIIGSSARDEVKAAGDLDFSTVSLESVEVVTATTASATVTIGAGISGLALAVAGGGGTLRLAGGGVFDLSSLTLRGFRSYEGAAGNTEFETVVLDQAVLDAVVEAAGDGGGADIFVGLTDTSAAGSDTVRLSGNVDFTGIDDGAHVDFRALDYGDAGLAHFGDLAATGIGSIIGGGPDDTLVIVPGDRAQDYTDLAIEGVETLQFDIATANAGRVDVTIDEETFSGLGRILGEINLIADPGDGGTIDLSDVSVVAGSDLSSRNDGDNGTPDDLSDDVPDTRLDLVSVTQDFLDGFETLAAGGNLNLAMAGDLSVAASRVKGGITVSGTAGGDTLTIQGNVEGSGQLPGGYSIALGAGDDSLTAGRGFVGDVDMGSGDNSVVGVIRGDLDLSGKDDAADRGADGVNTVVALVPGTISGGGGADNISVGGALGGGDLGAGDDSFSGVARRTLNLGAGDDSYTSAAQYLGNIFNSRNADGDVDLAGAAVIAGGAGDDSFNIDNSFSVLEGGAGRDVFTIHALAFGTSANGQGGAVIRDLNAGGDRDTLRLNLVGTTTATVAKMTTAGAMTMTVTTPLAGLNSGTIRRGVESALAAALTRDGGLRVLNQQGLATIAPGESLGTTVGLLTLDRFDGDGNKDRLLDYLRGDDDRVGRDLADTTYVVFALTDALESDAAANPHKLVAFLITAADNATDTVNAGEVSTVTIASIAGRGLNPADIVLI